jgi:hypothetical protein
MICHPQFHLTKVIVKNYCFDNFPWKYFGMWILLLLNCMNLFLASEYSSELNLHFSVTLWNSRRNFNKAGEYVTVKNFSLIREKMCKRQDSSVGRAWNSIPRVPGLSPNQTAHFKFLWKFWKIIFKSKIL